MLRVFRLLLSFFVPVHSLICPADISGGPQNSKDGLVNVEDLMIVLRDYGGLSLQGDINKNGVVDVEDVLIVLNDYDRQDCDKPKPNSHIGAIGFCKTNKPQTCRKICPSLSMLQSSLSCKKGNCYERIGTCCQFGCKIKPSCGSYPCDCVQWFDGCNRCSINQGKIQTCTNMACFIKGPTYCVRYINGTNCKSPKHCSPPIIRPPPPPNPGEVVIGRPFLQDHILLRSESTYENTDIDGWVGDLK